MGTPYRSVAVMQALLGAAVVAAIVSRAVLEPATAVPAGPHAGIVALLLVLALAWGGAAFLSTRWLLRGGGRRTAIGLWAVAALAFPVGTLLAAYPLWVLVRGEPAPGATKP